MSAVSGGSDTTEASRIIEGVQSFQDAMRAKDIHVGMPGRDRVVRCVTCGFVWPCNLQRERKVEEL